MDADSTTVRIKRHDKAKLDELCRLTRRGIVHMLGLLIDQELERLKTPKKRRKVG